MCYVSSSRFGVKSLGVNDQGERNMFSDNARSIVLAVAMIFLSRAPVASADDVRPNILLLADKWAWPHAGICGDTSVKTPTIDRLSREGAEGVLFTHAFCQVPS